jgi:hypothetical protein
MKPDQQRNGNRRRKRSRDDSNIGSAQQIQVGTAVEMMAIERLKPARVNDRIYKPVDLDDPSILKLGRDMIEKGQVLEPLVVTIDNTIISGHRRRAAAEVAGFTHVPVRRINITSTDPRFESYLIAFNEQRVKTAVEQIREEVIRTSPEDAHNALLAHQKIEMARANRRASDAGLRILGESGARVRSQISEAKRPMLAAAMEVIQKYEDFWPLTLRQIHYRLLTRNVLRNSKKPSSLYVNNQDCYKDLSDLLTRARLAGEVPWESMHDPTRPRTTWVQYESVGAYVREQLDRFLCGYKRDLLQSQPAYIELVVEKLTVQEIAERAAGYYHVPVGVGRGYSSVTSLDETADRFHASGKRSFILLIAGDLDPEGENICDIWGGCLRDEHRVENLTTIKVGVNPDQVLEYNLSPLPVKSSSSRAAGFLETHGQGAYELEAFEPDQLQEIIRDAIRGVLDMARFAEEQRKEAEDARYLMAYRSQVRETLKECHPD